MKSKRQILLALAQGKVNRSELPYILENTVQVFTLTEGKFRGKAPVDYDTGLPLSYEEAKIKFPHFRFINFVGVKPGQR